MTKGDFIFKWAKRFKRNNSFLISPEDFQEFAEDVGYFFGLFKSTGGVWLSQKAGTTSFSLGPAQRDPAKLRIRKFGSAGLLKALPALPLPADRPANIPAPGDVLLLPAAGVPVAGSPEISEHGETVEAGQSIQVTGEQLAGARAAVFAGGKLLPAAVAGNTSQGAAIQLPTNSGAFGACVLWLENGQGYGEPVLLNRTHATWMTTTLAAGTTGHVLGVNLTYRNEAGGDCYLYMVHKVTGAVVAVPVLGNTIPERVSFLTPPMPLGEYWVYPHNGHGGEWGWSERLSCTIVSASDDVRTHEWQVGTTLTNTGGNMAPTINAAILADSRSDKYTRLPAGTWLAGEGIEVVSNCSLRGEVDGKGVPLTIITPDPARFDPSGDRGLLGSPAPKEMMRLENLIIDNSKGAAMGPVNRLVVLRRCRQVWLKNVWVIQPGGGLVRLDEDTHGLYIDECKFRGGSAANGEPIFVLPSPEAQLFVSNTEFKLYDNADSALNISGVSQIAILPGCTVGNGDDRVLNGAFAGKGRFLKGSGAYGIGSECWHVEATIGTNLGVMRDWLGTTSNPVLNPTGDDNEGECIMYEGAETRGKLPVVSATRTTITSSSKPTSDKYTGAAPFAHYAHIVRGRGMGQMRRLVANDGNGTLTFDKPWRVIPDSTSLVMYGTYCRFVHVVECDFSARPGMNGTNYSASKFLEIYGGCHKWRGRRNKIKGFRSGLSTFTTQHNSNDFIDSCSHNELTDNILIDCRYGVRIEVTGEGGGGLPSGGGYPAPGQVALHLRNQVVNPVLYNTIIAAARTDDPTTATNFPYPLITGLLLEGDQPVLPFPNDYRTTSNPQRFPVIDVGPNQLAGVVLAVAAATATALVGNTTDDLGPPEPLPTPVSFTADKLSFPNADQLVLGQLDDQSQFVPLTRTPADAGATTSTPVPGGGYTDAQIDAFLASLATKQQVADLIGAAPTALDTLAELAAWAQTDRSGVTDLLRRVGLLEAKPAPVAYTGGDYITVSPSNVISASIAEPLTIVHQQATSLDASAFGRRHVFTSGAGSYFGCTLPDIVGNLNKTLTIIIDADATGLWQFTGGDFDDRLWAGESLQLQCTDTGYRRIGGNKIPMTCDIGLTPVGPQTMLGLSSNGGVNALGLPYTFLDQSPGMAQQGHILIRRAGRYVPQLSGRVDAPQGSNIQLFAMVNGSANAENVAFNNLVSVGAVNSMSLPSLARNYRVGDEITFGYYFSAGGGAVWNALDYQYFLLHFSVTEITF